MQAQYGDLVLPTDIFHKSIACEVCCPPPSDM